jgi:hypothetical protein
MTTSNLGLTRVSSEELIRLLKALHRGTLHEPISRSALIAGAFGNSEGGLGPIVGRDVASAIAMISAVLAERGQVQARSLSLVHQGPVVAGTCSRSVLDQVLDLVASALVSVDVCGLTLSDDRRIGRSLAALVAARGLRVRILFACENNARAQADIATFLAERGLNQPSVEAWWCPRARLRSRVVLVDDVNALLTSAELTSTEDDATIDSGVLVADAGLVNAIRAEWERLMRAGELVPVEQ